MDRRTLALITLVTAFASHTATAQVHYTYGNHDAWVNASRDKWVAFGELQTKIGNNRTLANGGAFVPLWQDSDSLIFADLRGQADDTENYEGQWGVGLRTLLSDDWILGVYGFYDHKWTGHDSNNFGQATFGAEVMSVNWEARVNGYLPETNKQSFSTPAILNRRNPRVAFNGNTLLLTTNGVDTFEAAYTGIDAEIGALLRAWGPNNDIELRAFAGGYHFDTNEDLPNISGPRGRIELRMYDFDFLGEGSRVTLGVEGQYDSVRDEQFFAMLRVRVPLGRKQRKLSPLERRFVDRVVRDEDIVTNTGQKLTGDFTENVKFPEGTPIGNFTLVNANTANVPAAVAGGQQLVIVDGSQGTLNTNAAIVMNNGQTLRGAGFTVTGCVTGAQTVFGTRPLIQAANNTFDTIQVTDNNTVRDLDVRGGQEGVSAGPNGDTDVANLTILNTTVSGALIDGYSFGDLNGNSLIANNVAFSNGQDGFEFGDIGANSVLRNNTANQNTSQGFTILGNNDGTISGNTANGNTARGFRSTGDNNGTFANNTATGNNQQGFQFTNNNGTLSGNTALRNGQDGFVFVNNNGMMLNNRQWQRHGRRSRRLQLC